MSSNVRTSFLRVPEVSTLRARAAWRVGSSSFKQENAQIASVVITYK